MQRAVADQVADVGRDPVGAGLDELVVVELLDPLGDHVDLVADHLDELAQHAVLLGVADAQHRGQQAVELRGRVQPVGCARRSRHAPPASRTVPVAATRTPAGVAVPAAVTVAAGATSRCWRATAVSRRAGRGRRPTTPGTLWATAMTAGPSTVRRTTAPRTRTPGAARPPPRRAPRRARGRGRPRPSAPSRNGTCTWSRTTTTTCGSPCSARESARSASRSPPGASGPSAPNATVTTTVGPARSGSTAGGGLRHAGEGAGEVLVVEDRHRPAERAHGQWGSAARAAEGGSGSLPPVAGRGVRHALEAERAVQQRRRGRRPGRCRPSPMPVR